MEELVQRARRLLVRPKTWHNVQESKTLDAQLAARAIEELALRYEHIIIRSQVAIVRAEYAPRVAILYIQGKSDCRWDEVTKSYDEAIESKVCDLTLPFLC